MIASSDGIQRGSTGVPNAAGAETSFRETALTARHRIPSGFEFGVRVPWVDIHAEEKGSPDENLSGIGDVAVFGEKEIGAGFRGVVGCKLPTGDEKASPKPGVIPPSLLQVGTGTFDPFVGFGWRAATGSTLWSAGGLWQLPIGESDASLAPGQVLQLQFAAGQTLSDELTASLGLEALFRGHDELLGNELAGTGSSIWSVTPGLSWAVGENTSLDVLARIPIETQVNRTQVVPGILVHFGLSWRF
ncbi:MAG: transporter [Planctomycetes bacterium]|nr:transporter [Planctomycetota bacterium]